MNSMEKFEFFMGLQRAFVSADTTDELTHLIDRTKNAIRKTFGDNSVYIAEFPKIDFSTLKDDFQRDDDGYYRYPYIEGWKEQQGKIINFLRILLDDLMLTPSSASISVQAKVGLSNRVFVVHGHDIEMKHSVARVLSKLGLESIILHEQVDRGHTIIEKFLEHAKGASFAVILLSPDDMAYPASDLSKKARPRARQNVILELGFFIGRLGRENVVALFRTTPEFELPSDVSGVLYKAYDASGAWQLELAKELKASGFDIDLNKLMN